MKLRYFSDLHLEFIKPNKMQNFLRKIPSGKDEVCILAGDIGNPYQPNYDIFMDFINVNFKKTFVIAGNHEYYNCKTMKETLIYLENYFTKFENISFLNNTCEYFENYCFVGTTLWSKVTKTDYPINDIYSIQNFDHVKYNKLNVLSIAFLKDALKNNENCIIITHHLPSESLIDAKYKTPKTMHYNQWFYCDLDNFIDVNKDKIKCWFYGHTHIPSNVLIHNIPFLCNPIGYPNENPKINLEKYVLLE
jgi:predicted phosphohydrolase